ncbi:DinB family protein [Paenibacillus harenae]|uniref:Damage-inducible protein DinB n=1 Tax=Paenibacillus harenae TaxID=306543 RepID=A0ABT9U566_PAEHA|nr:DinB family protein [Paenibacillus harenae]MDQ0114784.1 putative damage-inducible protein DinB [Paenibacillus harenae]
MNENLFTQIESIRNLTIKAVEGISEQTLDIVPEGFNNSLRWNLGHIYLVQEKFAFHFAGEPVQLSESFERLFARGTKPADWNEEPPTREVLLEMLAEQPIRIQKALLGRVDEPVKAPYTTGSGVLLSTIGEFLTFTLYHEGMHINTIRLLKRFAN